MILFIEKDFNDADLNGIVNLSSAFQLNEMVSIGYKNTAIIVLLDEENKKAYCVPPVKYKLSLYSTGYRLIKKIFKGNS